MTEFRWSDAWLLYATGLAAASEPASLPRVIFYADAIEHAVITWEELDGGASRLLAAGYIDIKRGRLSLTHQGNQLFASTSAGLRTHSECLAALQARLGAPSWQPGDDPRLARAKEPIVIPRGDYDEAVSRYQTTSLRKAHLL
jgi:hypothetical protein